MIHSSNTRHVLMDYAAAGAGNRRWRWRRPVAWSLGFVAAVLLMFEVVQSIFKVWGILAIDTGGVSCIVNVAGKQCDWDDDWFAAFPFGTNMDKIQITPQMFWSDCRYRRGGCLVFNNQAIVRINSKDPGFTCVMQLTERRWWGIHIVTKWVPVQPMDSQEDSGEQED